MAEKVIKVKVDKIGAQRDLNAINKALKDAGVNAEVFKEKAEGASGGLSKMIPKLTTIAGGVIKVATAIAAVTAALVSFTRQNTLAIKEMEKSARLAGLNAQAFQAYSYAANSVGVSQEKFGDILKDVNDKVGDFITTGGGEFKDVFESVLKPIGVTTEQLREMSSVEVLGAVQKGLEELGANGQEATFILEAIANDATLLKPLLENNGKALKELSKEASDFGLIITQDQIESAKEFNRQFELLEKQTTIFGQSISAELAEPMKELVKLSGLLLSSLSQTFEIGLNAKIENKKQEISELELALFERISSGAKKFGDVSVLDALNPFSTDTGDTDAMTADLQKLRKELELLESQKKKIDDSISNGAGGDSGGGGGGDSKDKLIEYLKAEIERLKSASDGGSSDTQDKELDRRKQYLQSWIDNVATYNMSATELNDAWRASELEKLKEWQSNNLEKEEEYRAAKNAIDKKWADKDKQIRDSELKAQEAGQKRVNTMVAQSNMDLARQSLSFIEQTSEEGSILQKAAFLGAQALAVSQALMNAEVAATSALLPPPIGLGPIAGQVMSATIRNQGYASAALIGAQTISGLASRQTGGYMNSNTPYQVGGGAHTSDPEMYTSGGKQYLIDSNAGKMTRLDKSSSGNQSSSFAVTVNNMGEPMSATARDGGVDETGVRRMIIDLTPDIVAQELGDRNSKSNQARTRWERPTESYR